MFAEYLRLAFQHRSELFVEKISIDDALVVFVAYRPLQYALHARHFDHITPVLRELHWLPVRQLIRFNLATTELKSLCGPVSFRTRVVGAKLHFENDKEYSVAANSI